MSTITLSLPVDLDAAIGVIASKEGRSRNEVILDFLEKGVDRNRDLLSALVPDPSPEPDPSAKCEKFPGVWERPVPTFGVYKVCDCAKCLREWPCPEVKAGDVIEVADSHGIYAATVVHGYMQDVRNWWERDTLPRKPPDLRYYVDIESNDPAAPEYLRERVRDKWSIARINSLWRLYNATTRWSPTPIGDRYDREVL